MAKAVRNRRLLAFICVGILWSAYGFSQGAMDSTTPADISTKLFRKYDVNHDGILTVGELTKYELGENPKYNDRDFRYLRGFKELATKKARQDAIDDIASIYGKEDSSLPGGYAVSPEDFRAYLLKTNPKVKAALIES